MKEEENKEKNEKSEKKFISLLSYRQINIMRS